MIRICTEADTEAILAIINDGAQRYRGVIPPDCWKEPYMSLSELEHELVAGVVFWGYEIDGQLAAVMGVQRVKDSTLIRHAYVRGTAQRQGIGSQLLMHLRKEAQGPLLVGTWTDAAWAVRFYEQHGFRLVSPEEKESLLRMYWTVPNRQIETSAVLTDSSRDANRTA